MPLTRYTRSVPSDSATSGTPGRKLRPRAGPPVRLGSAHRPLPPPGRADSTERRAQHAAYGCLHVAYLWIGTRRSRACLRADARRFGHPPVIEPERHMPGVTLPERAHHRTVDDAVLVRLAGRAEAGVEPRLALLDLQDPNRARQRRVQRALQRRCIERQRHLRARHLTGGMHARVGASGAGDRHGRPLDTRERLLQGPLDRRPRWLAAASPRKSVPSYARSSLIVRTASLTRGAVVVRRAAHGKRQTLRGPRARFHHRDALRAEGTRWPDPTSGRSTASRAANGTSSPVEPPPRSTSAAAPTTSAPAARATSMVSRVDNPVVTTSSTTSTRSPGARWNPRRSSEPAVLSLGKERPNAERPRHLVADDHAAQRR